MVRDSRPDRSAALVDLPWTGATAPGFHGGMSDRARLQDPVCVRAVADVDMERVLAIYEEGLATRLATFETSVPSADEMRARWLPGLAWVAELGAEVVGWTAVTPTS